MHKAYKGRDGWFSNLHDRFADWKKQGKLVDPLRLANSRNRNMTRYIRWLYEIKRINGQTSTLDFLENFYAKVNNGEIPVEALLGEHGYTLYRAKLTQRMETLENERADLPECDSTVAGVEA